MLHAYFDSSAILPLLIEEPTTAACRDFLDGVDVRLSSKLSYVEISAGLARAERMGRITAAERDTAWQQFEAHWEYFLPVNADDAIITTAASLAAVYSLRGSGAVQCATAIAVAADAEYCAVSGDRQLLRAWSEEGVTTVDINRLTGGEAGR